LKVKFCSGSSSSSMAPEGLNMALRVSLSISSSKMTGLFTFIDMRAWMMAPGMLPM